MSGDNFWNTESDNNEFESRMEYYYKPNYDNSHYTGAAGTEMNYSESNFSHTFNDSISNFNCGFEDEPPLLEELEIYPDRIVEKTLAVLNPFQNRSFTQSSELLSKESDLAGPITFCVVLAMCLFLTGSKAHFGYIYGLSTISCLLMYILLTLMTASNEIFTLGNVASTLGYCLLPIVLLSIIAVFASIHTYFGIIMALAAIVWSSLSASRSFIVMSGDSDQRALIAYPCLLVYGVFAVIVVF